MKENEASRLREFSRDEVEIRLRDLQEELRNIRFRASMKQETNPVRLRELRRDIARVKTLLHEDELGIKSLAKADDAVK